MNKEWIAGVVDVVGIALCASALLGYGIWDVVRLRRGQNLSITASSWLAKFFVRHPYVTFGTGLLTGLLTQHLLPWVTRPCIP